MPDSPPLAAAVCQKLFSGYQFSRTDVGSPFEPMFVSLEQNFSWFQTHLAAIGFQLKQEGGVFLLQNDDKELSQEERQTVVALFLLVDLWLEKGKSMGDLFLLPVAWRELDWFREGYGRDYLLQVNIQPRDIEALEGLWQRLARKGVVEYSALTSSLTLRHPADRIIQLSRRLQQQLQQEATDENSE